MPCENTYLSFGHNVTWKAAGFNNMSQWFQVRSHFYHYSQSEDWFTLSVPNFRLHLSFASVFFFFFSNYKLKRSLYVKLKDWMSNSIDPDETAHNEPSHLDLCCLQKKNWMSNSIDPDETAHYEPSHLDLCCLQKKNWMSYLWQWKS